VIDAGVGERRLDLGFGDGVGEVGGPLQRVTTRDVARLRLRFPFDDDGVQSRLRDRRGRVTTDGAGTHHRDVRLVGGTHWQELAADRAKLLSSGATALSLACVCRRQLGVSRGSNTPDPW